MMPLPAAAHAAVAAETRQRRNASARARRLTRKEAEAWCAERDAEVQRFDHHGEWRWTIRVPGFFPVTSDTLEGAVRVLDFTIACWCDSSSTTHGPTGASLARYRALRETG